MVQNNGRMPPLLLKVIQGSSEQLQGRGHLRLGLPSCTLPCVGVPHTSGSASHTLVPGSRATQAEVWLSWLQGGRDHGSQPSGGHRQQTLAFHTLSVGVHGVETWGLGYLYQDLEGWGYLEPPAWHTGRKHLLDPRKVEPAGGATSMDNHLSQLCRGAFQICLAWKAEHQTKRIILKP